MVKITYIESSGIEHQVEVPVGRSVMEGAVKNNIPGIDAECMGACACATCHVYVDPKWMPALSPRSDQESTLIEYVENVQENSRLSCQIKVTEVLEGLVVRIPESQH
ncbi:MAG: 2Fe-2S iron-sulfur cluster-binding protein [Steroidobacteraceae bacterium]